MLMLIRTDPKEVSISKNQRCHVNLYVLWDTACYLDGTKCDDVFQPIQGRRVCELQQF